MPGITPLRKIWYNGRLVDWAEAKVHVLSHGLHYGYAVFEGIRAFNTAHGGEVFRLDEHLDRFVNSARIYRMKLPYTIAELKRATLEMMIANEIEEAYIRPIAFSGYGQMGLDPTRCEIDVAIGAWEWGPYLGKAGVEDGVKAMVSSWVRVDSRSMPPQAKCAANYANSALAKMEALEGRCDEAILLNSTGLVAEGPGENIFKVKNRIVSTPPASSGILRGITRDTVIQFVKDEGLTFHRSDFTREEMYTADELFFTGTAAGVTPIREVDGRAIGTGDYPVTRRIQALYDEVTHGRTKTHKEWLTYIRPTRTLLAA